MADTTHCRQCGERIWWEESAKRRCWVSRLNGSWCVEETNHQPEDDNVSDHIEEIINRIERGARITRPDKTLSGYVLEVDDWRSIRAALRGVARSEEIVWPCPVCGGELSHGHHYTGAPGHPKDQPGCGRCDFTGWRDDPSACGDPDHCSSVIACSCNPEYL